MNNVCGSISTLSTHAMHIDGNAMSYLQVDNDLL